MNKIICIEEYQPHIVQEVMCIKCLHRWIDVRPKTLWLKDCICPHCKESGYCISTGQVINDENT